MSAHPRPTGEPARRAWPRWVPILIAILLVAMLTALADRAPGGVAAAGTVPPGLLNYSLLSGNFGNGLYTATPAQLQSLQNLEQRAVANTLADHGLAAGDAAAAESWARDDALGEFWGLIVEAIQTPAASRSADQQNAAAWLAAVAQRQGVLAAEDAGAEYVKWAGLSQAQYQSLLAANADQGTLQAFFASNVFQATGICSYRSPAPYQSEYTDWDSTFCNDPFTGTFGQPPPPTYDQFARWGQAAANPTVNSAAFVGLSRDVAEGIALGGSLTGAAAVGVAIGTNSALATALSGSAFQIALHPFAARVLQTDVDAAVEAAEATAEAAGEDTAEATAEAAAEVAATAAEVGGTVAAASVGSIVAAVIGFTIVAVLEIINIVQAAQLPGQLAQGIVAARAATPDPAAMLGDANGVGALYSLFIGAALPTPRAATCDNTVQSAVSAKLGPCLNAPAVPDAAPTDPLFAIQAQGAATPTYTPSLTWRDSASGVTTTARLHETWFVDTVSATGLPPTTTQTLRIKYTDWDGNEQTGWLFRDPALGYRFQTVKALDPNAPPMNPQTCVADQTCASGATIQFIGADGQKYTAGLVDPQAPRVAPTVGGNATMGSPVTLTANATSPLGQAVTDQWQFLAPDQAILTCDPDYGWTCDSWGAATAGAQIQHTFPSPGVWTVRLTATDANGLATSTTFDVAVADNGQPPTLTLSPAADPILGCGAALTCDERTGAPGQTMKLTGAGTLNDGSVGVHREVNWGDGSPVDNGADLVQVFYATPPPPGTPFAYAFSHAYAAPGRYTATATVVDTDGRMAVATAIYTIQAPTTLTWAASVSIVYGTPLGAAQPAPTASVPGAFTYTVDGRPATVDTVLPPGQHTVTVSFTPAEPDVYTPPAPVTVSLTVTPAPLTVTATPSVPSMTYGGQNGLTLIVGFKGFVNGDNGGSLGGNPPNCDLADASGQAVTIGPTLPVGTYTITCSGLTSPNYIITYQPTTFSITPAPLTVTSLSPVTSYGYLPLPNLNGVAYSGFVNGEGPGVLGGALSCALTDGAGKAVTLSANLPAGTYTVTCQGQTAANYALTYKPGTLTVVKAPLTVTANDRSMVYGGPVPTLDASVSGLLNGDPASVFSGATCTARDAGGNPVGGTTPVGAYRITCAGGSAANYFGATYQPGTLTITPAPLTVTAPSATMTYGAQSLPDLSTPTYSGFVGGDGPGMLGGALSCGLTDGNGKAATLSASLPAGKYTVTCSGQTASGYVITYKSGTLTVNPAALTVTADDQTRLFGAPNPALTAHYSGFVNGETAATAGLSGAPACTTTATQSSPGGSYPITCAAGTLAATNYTFTFAAGTLTITYTGGGCLTGGQATPLTVQAGQAVCLGPGFRQTGPLRVQAGGALDLESATLVGPVQADGASAVRLCGVTLTGPLTVTGTTGPVVVGDDAACAGNTITGPVSLTKNHGGVIFDGNTVTGPVSITGTTGANPPPYASPVDDRDNKVTGPHPAPSQRSPGPEPGV